jgi:hypothetical protein
VLSALVAVTVTVFCVVPFGARVLRVSKAWPFESVYRGDPPLSRNSWSTATPTALTVKMTGTFCTVLPTVSKTLAAIAACREVASSWGWRSR